MTGTGPLGCVPAELAQRSRVGECAVELQRASALFNPQLAQMLNGLNSQLGSNVFIAVNANEMHMDWISNPQAYGMPLHISTQHLILILEYIYNDLIIKLSKLETVLSNIEQ